jgi:hypothetical protein
LPTWDSKIAVYSGSCGALVCVTTDDDFCAPLSQATWTADVNETYYIYVLGFGAADEGAFSLALNCTNTPVAATATVVDDCGTSSFDVDVDVTDLGGAASVTIAYSVNGVAQTPLTGVLAGVTNLGPFTAGDEVSITVSNGATGCTAEPVQQLPGGCGMRIDRDLHALLPERGYPYLDLQPTERG